MHRLLPEPYSLTYEPLVRAALEEDLGLAGDLTSDAVVPATARARARIAARQEGRVAGLGPALAAFRLVDPALKISIEAGDGADVPAGATLATVDGAARTILSGERTALNLLGRLCGIATATRTAVRAVAGTHARIVCTRKTTPGLRALEKYAVRVGGGANHRFGLDDGILIKDNHLVAAGGLEPAVRRARAYAGHMVRIEVEVDTLEQLGEALGLGIDAVLLDNMPPGTLREAVRMVAGRAVTEASGGVTPGTVAEVAAAGVDLISLGWLTHSVAGLDVGLDFETV
jgi:nicotinate-nucleotide pyrophosphorylase (carboxylating)